MPDSTAAISSKQQQTCTLSPLAATRILRPPALGWGSEGRKGEIHARREKITGKFLFFSPPFLFSYKALSHHFLPRWAVAGGGEAFGAHFSSFLVGCLPSQPASGIASPPPTNGRRRKTDFWCFRRFFSLIRAAKTPQIGHR